MVLQLVDKGLAYFKKPGAAKISAESINWTKFFVINIYIIEKS